MTDSDETMAITVVSNGTPSPASISNGKRAVKRSSKGHKFLKISGNLTPVPVGPSASGEGLPYAPDGFPNPDDKWAWKVGRRRNKNGYWTDRYLLLPKSLLKGGGHVNFKSKFAVEKYMKEKFPDVDLQFFFSSFIWTVPCTLQTDEGLTGSSAKRSRGSDLIVYRRTPNKRACNAGNVKCCLEMGKVNFSKAMACDICCVESGFCRECSCILCGKSVDHDLDEHYFIRCQGKLSDELICGHVAHLECAIICQTGGVVKSIGLDVEYYCRRCDNKTDLLKHVLGLVTTPVSGKGRPDIEICLNLALRLIQGTQKKRCRSLVSLIQTGVKKLQSGMELQDIFGDAQDSTVTINAAHDEIQEVDIGVETTHKEGGTQTEGPSGSLEPSIPVTQVQMVLANLFDHTLPVDGSNLPDVKLQSAYPFTIAFAPALRAIEMRAEQDQRIRTMDGELRAHARIIQAQASQIQNLQDHIKSLRFQVNTLQHALLQQQSFNQLKTRRKPRIDNESTISGVSHRA